MSAAPELTQPITEALGSAKESKESATRVLIAEDDHAVRRLVQRSLEGAGFATLPAKDGAEALEIVEGDPPDLALIDLGLPLAPGLQVIDKIKTTYGPALPCLVLSGLSDPQERMDAFDAGADDFVGKPLRMPELLKRVEAFERSRRAYMEARRANETADRLRLFVSETAALLAHDLNNGLSVASANLSFVSETLEDDGEIRDAIEGSERALRRMTALVRNFVDIARFEDAALTPSRTRVDVSELLSTAAVIHDPQNVRDGAQIETRCAPGLTASLDPVLVERVIHNLLNNATRYVNRNGTIKLEAQPYEEEDGSPWLRISVGNTGSPVPEALRPSIFEKYRVGPDGRAQRGMGLYFCRLASEALGGSIALEGNEEWPTEFIIRVPLTSERDSTD